MSTLKRHEYQRLGDHIIVSSRPLKSRDPILFPVDGDEFLIFITPILGPSATLIAHRIARLIRERGTTTLHVNEFCRHFGIPPATFERALNRLGNFGYAEYANGIWYLFTDVNYVPVKWLDQMPPVIAQALMEWQRVTAVKAG